ncbi:MAG: DNA-binding domain-containing protein, partial [Longimicrobiales bacterium]
CYDAPRAAATAPLFRDPPALALERLAVYRGNVDGNCAKALANAYPILRTVVGGEFFDAMARDVYLTRDQGRTWTQIASQGKAM